MNAAHFHLMVNHLPIILPIAGLMVMVFGFIFRSDLVKQVAYFIFICSAIAAFLALESGGKAAGLIKELPWAEPSFIKQHATTANCYAWMSYGLGIWSIIGAWVNYKDKKYEEVFSVVATLFAVVMLFFGARTATTGGEIRHKEIRKEMGDNPTALLAPTLITTSCQTKVS